MSNTLNPNFRLSQLFRPLLANWTPNSQQFLKIGKKRKRLFALFSFSASTDSVKRFECWRECLHYVLPSLILCISPEPVHDAIRALLHLPDCCIYVLDIREVRIHLRPPQVLELVQSGELPGAAQGLELDIEGFRCSPASGFYTRIGRPHSKEGPYHPFVLSVTRPEVVRDGARIREFLGADFRVGQPLTKQVRHVGDCRCEFPVLLDDVGCLVVQHGYSDQLVVHLVTRGQVYAKSLSPYGTACRELCD